MGYLTPTLQANPPTPSQDSARIFVDSIAEILCVKDDSGRVRGQSNNSSIASQGAGFATDTYVTGSDLIIPSFGLQARTMFRWVLSASKTAAGTATPVYSIRI